MAVQEVTTPMASNISNWSQNLQTFDSSAYNTAVASARDAGTSSQASQACPPAELAIKLYRALHNKVCSICILGWNAAEISLEKEKHVAQSIYVLI